MTVTRTPRPPAFAVERVYDGDDAAAVSALVELVRYSEARGLAATIDRERGLAVAAEAGLDLDAHRQVCQSLECWFCAPRRSSASRSAPGSGRPGGRSP